MDSMADRLGHRVGGPPDNGECVFVARLHPKLIFVEASQTGTCQNRLRLECCWIGFFGLDACQQVSQTCKVVQLQYLPARGRQRHGAPGHRVAACPSASPHRSPLRCCFTADQGRAAQAAVGVCSVLQSGVPACAPTPAPAAAAAAPPRPASKQRRPHVHKSHIPTLGTARSGRPRRHQAGALQPRGEIFRQPSCVLERLPIVVSRQLARRAQPVTARPWPCPCPWP